MKRLSEAHKNAIAAGMRGHHVSNEQKQKTAESVRQYYIQNPVTAETRAQHSKNARRSWSGGQEGDAFARILLPCGYLRELRVRCSETGTSYLLDFAHPEAYVDIELDGPYHMTNSKEDARRDATLRGLGWKVIRIKH